jgi:hypothetical protein
LVSWGTALLTVQLAFRRFKNEALWSRKLEAYTKILEALHHARLEAERNYENECRFTSEEGSESSRYSSEYKLHLEEMKKAKLRTGSEMNKLLDTGTLIMSPQAIAFLKEALKPRYEDWKNEPGVVFWQTEEENMRKAIDRISQIARADLGV